MTITRREFVAGAVAASTLARSGVSLAQPSGPVPSLKNLGAPCGMRVGFATKPSALAIPAYAEFVTANFNMLTPEGAMKWDSLRPTQDQFNFDGADKLMSFAQRTGMAVHGHNLCWNTGNPAWLASTLNKQNAEKILTDHIMTVAGRYAGKIDSWDVVNEPIALWHGRPDGLYKGPWLDMLGPGYIDIAFRAAAAADPKALRVLNIHNIEHGEPDSEKARQAALNLVRQLVARNVPIQAVGVESHLDAERPLDAAELTRFVQGVRALGLQVLVTELDVNDSKIAGGIAERDQAVAAQYARYLDIVIPAMNLKRLIFWSLTDKGNWMNYMKGAPRWQREDNAPHRPSLTDENLQPKPSYFAVASSLQRFCRTR